MSHLSYLILSRSERTRTCTRSHTHTSLQSRPFGELPQWRQQSPPNAGALWMGSGCSVQKTCSQLVWLVARGDKQTEHRTEGERERESCCHQRWIQRLNAGVQGDYDEEGACMHALICKSRFSCFVFFFPIQGTESGELLMKLQAHWGAAWTVFASRSRHCCSCFPGWNNSFLRFHPRNTCEPTLTALHGAWRVSRNRGVSALFVISARIFSTPLSNPVILYAFVT